MTLTALLQVYVFILAGFVGFFTITRVPPLLHTPLMSATSTVLGVIAVTSATINVVGGFMITDRMVRMFRKDGGPKALKPEEAKVAKGKSPA